MPTEIVRGTFAGTGASSAVTGHRIDVLMDFAGTASVDIEVEMAAGAWIKKTVAITADHVSTLDFAAPQTVRLNCTAYTNDVAYVLKRGESR